MCFPTRDCSGRSSSGLNQRLCSNAGAIAASWLHCGVGGRQSGGWRKVSGGGHGCEGAAEGGAPAGWGVAHAWCGLHHQQPYQAAPLVLGQLHLQRRSLALQRVGYSSPNPGLAIFVACGNQRGVRKQCFAFQWCTPEAGALSRRRRARRPPAAAAAGSRWSCRPPPRRGALTPRACNPSSCDKQSAWHSRECVLLS